MTAEISLAGAPTNGNASLPPFSIVKSIRKCIGGSLCQGVPLRCLSLLRWKAHDGFLGEGEMVTPPPYPTISAKFMWVRSASQWPPLKGVAWRDAPRRCVVTYLVKQTSLCGIGIFIFLVFQLRIFSYAIFIQPDRTDTISSWLQMSSPVPFSEFWISIIKAIFP